MLDFEVLTVYTVATLLLCIAPGPDNIFVLTQSALRGRAAGLLVTLGLCTGLLVHTSAVAFGVAVIFQASALAFTVLKLAGAAYLLYLAWMAFRASSAKLGGGQTPALSPAKLYVRGIIMNVTNPKVSIFFLAFLPQFADPARGSITWQMIMLGGVFIACTLLVFGGVALLAGALGEWLFRSARVQKMLNIITGTIFVALAVRLALAER